MPTLQFSSYKGLKGTMGAFQINFNRPHFYCMKFPKLKNYEGKFIPTAWLQDHPDLTKDDLSSREGCLFVEITSAVPGKKNVYDWEQKIVMALSITDMSKVLLVLEGRKPEINILHDPNAQTETAGKVVKTMAISSPKGISEGVIFNVSQKEADGQVRKHMVPLNQDETIALQCLVRAAVPLCLAWT